MFLRILNVYWSAFLTFQFILFVNRVKSDFSKDKPRLPAYSFGASNKVYKRVSNFGKNDILDHDIPGPGTYEKDSMIGTEGWKITMGVGKKNTIKNLAPRNDDVPGPGYYEAKENINSKGVYYASNHQNVKSVPYRPSMRFKQKFSDVPGPGNYSSEHPYRIGYFMKSRNFNCSPFGFGTDSRKSMEIKSIMANPGPGSYNLPSEFGNTLQESDDYFIKSQ